MEIDKAIMASINKVLEAWKKENTITNKTLRRAGLPIHRTVYDELNERKVLAADWIFSRHEEIEKGICKESRRVRDFVEVTFKAAFIDLMRGGK